MYHLKSGTLARYAYGDGVMLTSLTLHTTEKVVITGDAKGVIRFWHCLSKRLHREVWCKLSGLTWPSSVIFGF